MFPDYENYEQLSSFTPGRLKAYREMLLQKTKPQVEFIRRNVFQPLGKKLDVVEVGCGNGRLLIGLHQAGILRVGYGVDLSESRIEFAKTWAKYLGISADFSLDFCVDNILYEPDIFTNADLGVCITGCFQYFYPFSPEAPTLLLESMRKAKYALFELYTKPQMGRTWSKLPPEDPWEYLLDEYEDVGDWVVHTKTFLKANGEKDVRVENLAYYSMDVFLGHLTRAGFGRIHYAKQNSTSMVVLVS